MASIPEKASYATFKWISEVEPIFATPQNADREHMKIRIKHPHPQGRAAEPNGGRDCHAQTAHAKEKRSQEGGFVVCGHAEEKQE